MGTWADTVSCAGARPSASSVGHKINREKEPGITISSIQFEPHLARAIDQGVLVYDDETDRIQYKAIDIEIPEYIIFGPKLCYLIASGNAGCQYCRLLDNIVKDLAPQIWWSEADTEIAVRFKVNSSITIYIFRDWSWHEGHQFNETNLMGFEVTNVGLPNLRSSLALGPDRHSLSRDTKSDHCLAFIKRSLSRCSEECECYSPSHQRIPQRLVYVQDQGIKLVEALQSHERYVALSHCWGDAIISKTTMGNRRQRLLNLPYDNLPQTFKDAIYVARHLGISYLWIDSLCIIQDSIDDWQRKSAKMIQYYENAYLTIAATSSGSSSETFLGPRPKEYCTRNFDLQRDNALTRAAVRQDPNVYLEDGTLANKCWDPLCARGWAYQEAAISRRVILFTKGGLTWQCTGYQTTETGYPLRPANHLNAHAVQVDRDESLDQWYRHIELYSLLQLTYHKDKLPAISGIAQKCYRGINSAYNAGLWACDMAYGLCWYARGMHLIEYHRLPSGSSAPSWSWASVDLGINHDVRYTEESRFLRYKTFISCLRFDSGNTGLDPYGEAKSASLNLRALVSPVQVSVEHGLECSLRWPTQAISDRWWLTLDDWSFEDRIWDEGRTVYKVYPDAYLGYSQGKSFADSGRRFQKIERVSEPSTSFTAVAALMVVEKATENTGRTYCRSLLLQQSNTPKTFRRLAKVNLYIDEPDETMADLRFSRALSLTLI